MSTELTDSHQATILKYRHEIAAIDAALEPLQVRRCELRSLLLSEIEAAQQAYLFPARIDPGRELSRARGNAGVSDA